MKEKKNIRKARLSGTNFLYGIILIITGVILEFRAVISNVILKNSLNLNLSEVNTTYEDSEIEVASNNNYNDGWMFPTSTSYYISSAYSSYHPAIDIVTTDGNTNIYAAYSGVIVTNSYKWDGGNYLVLRQDNGYYSLYCHLSEKLAVEGQRVEKGQVIGIMGRTGKATGVHLHYSIWTGYPYRNSKSINPLNFY